MYVWYVCVCIQCIYVHVSPPLYTHTQYTHTQHTHTQYTHTHTHTHTGADSVSSEVLAAVSDEERKRQEAIFELLTSERHYTDSLKLVKEVFFDPMYETNALSEEDIAKVKVNWDDLIQCSDGLLKAFMVRLRTSGAIVKNIGDVLVNQIPELTPHVRWCSCQLNACTLLQQKSSDPVFKEFEQRCKADSRTGGLPLSSFLLKPMQRVTKYPLLVKRVSLLLTLSLKHTLVLVYLVAR